MPWSKDAMILGRMELVEKLWAQGYSSNQMMSVVNDRMKELGVPPVSIRTIKRDKQRLLSRFEEETEDARAEHIESLKLVKRKAWDAFENTPAGSLNKSSYLNTIRATEETISKLDGSMQNKVIVEGQLEVKHVAAVLMEVLISKFDMQTAEDVLSDFTTRVAAVEVIDAK